MIPFTAVELADCLLLSIIMNPFQATVLFAAAPLYQKGAKEAAPFRAFLLGLLQFFTVTLINLPPPLDFRRHIWQAEVFCRSWFL